MGIFIISLWSLVCLPKNTSVLRNVQWVIMSEKVTPQVVGNQFSCDSPNYCQSNDTMYTAANVTSILNDVLNPVKYDRKLRPGFGGKPVAIYTDMLLRSMSSISEKDMVYSIEIYFRQRWMDARLATNVSFENISLNIKILDRIWFPDTVFYNGRKSHLHYIPTPNRFIRISPNGSMYFSQRLTVRAICQMKLQTYPLDSQICPLQIGSFAYSTDDVLYLWRYGPIHSVQTASDMTMSQFDLISFSTTYSNISRKGSLHSCLTVMFRLRRHTGYFLIHIVVPCSLLVVLSWVSFWINREATADRIALGTTTVLTMTFLALDNRDDLPRVSYATALDLYVAMCFIFVLSTLVQFAIVHRFTKTGHGDTCMETQDNNCDDDSTIQANSQRDIQETSLNGSSFSKRAAGGNRTRVFLSRDENRLRVWFSSLKWKGKSLIGKKDNNEINSVSQIDKASRILFPITFIILNIAYWIFFLT